MDTPYIDPVLFEGYECAARLVNLLGRNSPNCNIFGENLGTVSVPARW